MRAVEQLRLTTTGDGLVQLEHELKLATASPPSDLPAFLDAWLQRLASVPVDQDTERRIALMIDCGWQYYIHGQRVIDGLRPIDEAVDLAYRIGSLNQQRRCHSVRGLMRSAVGYFAEGVEDLVTAKSLAESWGDQMAVAAAWLNLAVALGENLMFSEALACYTMGDTALVSVDAGERKDYLLSRAVQGRAFANYNLGRFQDAVRGSHAAIALLSAPPTPEQEQVRCLAETTCVSALIRLNRVDEAADHAAEARRWADKCGARRADVDANIASARVEVARGNIEQAIAVLLKARKAALSMRGSELDALEGLGTAYETAGQPDVALAYWQERLAFRRAETVAAVTARHDELIRQLGVAAGVAPPLESAATTRLQRVLAARLNDLVNTAVRANLYAGHDARRPFRIAKLVQLFALSEGWSAETADELKQAAHLADIGMHAIMKEVLRKSGRLSPAEHRVVDQHADIGADLLEGMRLETLRHAVDVTRFHHERFDGKGPHGLAGDAIPAGAQFVSLADAYDAMTQPRLYRPKPLSVPAALREIVRCGGSQFDAGLAGRFAQFVQSLYWREDDFDEFLAEDAAENALVTAMAKVDSLVASARDSM